MTAFIAVLRNDLCRLMEEKARIILMQVMIAGSIAIAILMNTKTASIGNIALVLSGDGMNISSPYLDIVVLDEVPPMSELVSNKFDAIVTISDNRYEIQTIKSDSFKETLESALINPSACHEESLIAKGTGSNILGYLVMFVLMQGVFLMYLFAEDKERKQLIRISSSPISFTAYLFAHSLFTFLMLYLPTLTILYVVSTIMGADLGMSFMQCSLLLECV